MILHSIRWKNFLSTGDNWSSFRLDKDPMVIIAGKNGTGKSTLLDAICFVLYKKPFRKINLPQLPNSINKKNCIVEVAFTSNDVQYVVRRGIKPNIFEIYKNKVLIDQSAATTDYQEVLEKEIIGCNYKTFCQVNILGSASYTAFMKLPAAHRREVVEDLLDSQVFSTMLVIAKAEYKEVVAKINKLRSDIDLSEAMIRTSERFIEKASQDNTQPILITKAQIQESVEALEKEQARLTVLQERLTNGLAKYQSIANADKVNEARSLYEKELSKLTLLLSVAEKERDVIVNASNCTVCQQDINADHKLHINTKYQEQIDQYNADILVKRGRLDKIMVLVNQLKEAAEDNRSIAHEVAEQKQFVQMANNGLNQRKAHLERLEADKPDASADLEELAKWKEGLVTQQAEYDNLHKQAQTLKDCFVKLGDDGIKAEIVNKYIPQINAKINENLENLDTFIQFTLNSEFEETIKSRYRDTFTYESFSEGQKLRIDLAILFTWRYIAQIRNSVSSNILIMDEILDRSLDVEGVEQFLSMVNKVTGAQNTIIISHNPAVVERFSNIIEAKLDGNYTTYSRYGDRQEPT